MSIVEFVDDLKNLKSPQKDVVEKSNKKSTPTRPTKASSDSKYSKSSTETKLTGSGGSRQEVVGTVSSLEAMWLASTLEKSPQNPAFQTMNLAPINPHQLE